MIPLILSVVFAMTSAFAAPASDTLEFSVVSPQGILVAGQEHRCPADVPRGAFFLEEGEFGALGAEVWAHPGRRQGGVDLTRRDAVHPDAAVTQLAGKSDGQADDGWHALSYPTGQNGGRPDDGVL